MKTVLLALAAALPLAAQVVNPTTGKKFETRTINGSGGNNGVSINGSTTPMPPPKAKLVSYFSLSESRQWKSSDGRSLLGSIIAFEESVIEIDAANSAAAKEAAQKAPPAKLPEKPTLIRDGKVRLLVNNKPYEVALELLSGEDRKFVEDLNARLPK
jgi:aspartate 1-decarboxylase